MSNSAAAVMDPVSERPDHVPDALVHDFDFVLDPGLARDPHARVRELVRTAPPIFWTPRQEGHWVLLGHAANFAAARDWEHFSSEMIPRQQAEALLAALPPGTPRIPQPVPQSIDPPRHTAYRAPLRQVFAPRSVLPLKDAIRAAADERVAAISGEGGCEFMSAVAEVLPVGIFLTLMGLPVERRIQYQDMLRAKLGGAGLSDIAGTTRKLMHIAAMMRDTIRERRDGPQPDIISRLWDSRIDGRPITIEEMEDYGVVLFLAGLDTVMNAMGYMACHLARNPDLQDELRAKPAAIGDAVEELLRLYGFVVLPRRVARDVVIQGVRMKAGERALLYLPAANLDPAAFPDPGVFDLEREDKAHIAFNAGPHRCVGSHLARIELQALCEALLSRLPRFRLAPDRPPTFRGGYTLAVASLHLEW